MTDAADRCAWLGPPSRDPRTIPETAIGTMRKGSRVVEARSRMVPLGPELRIYVDGQFVWSQVVRDGPIQPLIAETRAVWETKGWSAATGRPCARDDGR